MDLRDQLRAVVLLAVYAVIFTLSTPGLESLSTGQLRTAQQIAKAKETRPDIFVDIEWAFVALNRSVRKPLVARLTPLQYPLRLNQTWTLYGNGDGRPSWMEIWVDGDLVYRSASWEYTFMRRQLRHRRIRPMVKTSTTKLQAANRPGLSRMILHFVHDSYPDAQTVELRYLRGRFLTTVPTTITHVEIASAPDWTFALEQR
ncbi:MAG: hypothetical protein AAFV53_42075 [Myxococcota bacterium]